MSLSKSFFTRLFPGLFFTAGLLISVFLSVPLAQAQCFALDGTCQTTCRVNETPEPSCSAERCVGLDSGKTFCKTLGSTPPSPSGPTNTPPAPTTPSPTGTGSGGGWSAGSAAISQFGLPETSEDRIIVNLLQWLLLLFTFTALIAFIISGFQYLLASGSETIIETAKRHMTWSLVGVIVGLSGWIIWQAVIRLLSGAAA